MLPGRHHIPLRLPPDLHARLDRALKRRGHTKQSFVQAAVTRALEELEDDLRAYDDRRQSRRDVRDARRTAEEPQGLGIRHSAGRRSIEEAEPTPAPSPPVQVVVNSGNGSGGNGSGGDLITRLAAYVTTGPDYERDGRLRRAVEMLRASSNGEEERQDLAQKLDAAVTARIKNQPSEFAKAKQAVSMTFDKMKDILR